MLRGVARRDTGQTYINPTLTNPLITGYTWATKPAASSNTGRTIRITDVGANAAGSLWTSDGTKWQVNSGQILLAQGAVPIGIAPTGTMGANGAVTLGTALGGTYSAANCGGIWLYYPAGAVASGSAAGFFWTVMTDTTAGTVFNTVYSPVSGTYPTIPAAPTPVVDAGPGAFTGVTASVTAITYTLAGGVLGNSGSLQHKVQLRNNNSGGSKAVQMLYGGSAFAGGTNTTSLGLQLTYEMRNMGVVTKQSGPNFSTAGIGAFLAVNSAVDAASAIAFSHASAATDWNILESWEMWARP